MVQQLPSLSLIFLNNKGLKNPGNFILDQYLLSNVLAWLKFSFHDKAVPGTRWRLEHENNSNTDTVIKINLLIILINW